MKKKQICRAVGAFNTAIFSYFTYRGLELTSAIYSNVDKLITSNVLHPYLKMMAVETAVTIPILTAIASLGIIDGTVDIKKGTHHYFGMNI